MISSKYKFIFIHIPKTGGNSIQTALAAYCDDQVHFRKSVGNVKNEDGAQGLDIFNDRLGFTSPAHKHATLEDYHDKLGDEIFSYFIFTAIRNPYDRVISATAFAKSNLAKTLRNEDFRLIKPQTDYLKLNGKIMVKHFIRFEQIQHDFDLLCHRLAIPTSVLPHKNASVRSSYASYYTPQTQQFVAAFYQNDFQHFDYAFEGDSLSGQSQ